MKTLKIVSVFTLLLLITSLSTFNFALSKTYSPAIDVISGDLELIKNGIVGNNIKFDAKEFDTMLGVEKIYSITILSLPSEEDGTLMLNDEAVKENQVIRRKNLSKLVFVPAEKSDYECDFTFGTVVPSGPVEATCRIFVLSKMNFAPDVSTSALSSTALKGQTYMNVNYYGKLEAVDPEGDAVRYKITAQPKKGFVYLLNPETGEYKFVPAANYTGKATFSYVALDKYGNESASAKVTITVNKNKTGVVFNDLKDTPLEVAAIFLNNKGIMGGRTIGNETYFNTDQPVSRGEFMAMAMCAMGVSAGDKFSPTEFADDSSIPPYLRGYIAKAAEKGYFVGIEEQETQKVYAYPNNQITVSEVALFLGNMIDADTPEIKDVFKDEDIPTWAESALYTLTELGVLVPVDGKISPYQPLTKGDCAQILYRLMNLKEEISLK